MQVPLPDDGSVTVAPFLSGVRTQFQGYGRSHSGTTMTSFQTALRHGSEEQVQAQVDAAVDRAL